MSILPSFYHEHLVLTDTCWKISDSIWFSSPWSTRSLSVFLPPDLKVHRPSLSMYEPLINAPKDFSAGQGWEWTSQEGGDWNAACGPSAVMLCKTPLSLAFRLCRGLVAISHSKRWLWLSDSLALIPSQPRDRRPTQCPFSGRLTLPLRSLALFWASLQARARTPSGSMLPLTGCCFWADY